MSNIELTTTSSPNFCDEDGNAYLVRCPLCGRENYSISVATGFCSWCRFDLNEHKILVKDGK
jgi:ribosomal protein L37E